MKTQKERIPPMGTKRSEYVLYQTRFGFSTDLIDTFHRFEVCRVRYEVVPRCSFFGIGIGRKWLLTLSLPVAWGEVTRSTADGPGLVSGVYVCTLTAEETPAFIQFCAEKLAPEVVQEIVKFLI